MSTQGIIPRQHRLWWQSSYDRGLDLLLKMWPAILSQYPDAELWVSYGWDLYDKGYANNPERLAWKERMNLLMKQKGITHFGRISKEKMGELRPQCGVWAYPTYFPEIFCISALECQRDGVVPVTMDDFALKETVGSGVKVTGDIYDPQIQSVYLASLLNMMTNEKMWKEEQLRGQAFAKQFSWDTIAKRWSKHFE